MNANLIAKIKKLEALSKSTNVHEAANAAAARERLIAEHQLTEADLASDGSTNQTPNEAAEFHADPLFAHDGERRIMWKEWLAQDLADLYGVVINCQYVRVKTKIDVYPYEGVVERVGFKCIGAKSDVELLRYQFAYLVSEIERLTQTFLRDNHFAKGEAKTAANNFRVGAVEGVTSAMRDARKTQIDQHCISVGNTTAALVLVSRHDAALALDRKMHPDKYKENGRRKSGRTVHTNANEAARTAGWAAGRGLHNAGALPAGATRQLGGKR